jgi:hypothetical protein
VVRAGQAGTTLQHVDLAQKDQHLAPGANFQVKANPNQPPGILESETLNPGANCQVKANPNQPPGILESETLNPGANCQVKANPNQPPRFPGIRL